MRPVPEHLSWIAPPQRRAAVPIRALLSVLLISGAIGLGQCDGGSKVEVTVLGLTPEISYLEVFPTLLSPAARSAAAARISSHLSAFTVELPAGSVGIVELAVRGRQGKGNDCLVAEGTGIVQFDGLRHARVDIELRPVAAQTACWLAVTTRGVGEAEVVSVPAGISCGGANRTCGAFFPLGQQVELRLKNVTSYFDSWDGEKACSGRDACKVTIGDKPQTVHVNLVEPRVCSGGRWCWEYPLPFGGVITAVWAASPTEVWAVGRDGVIWRRSRPAAMPLVAGGWEAVSSGTRVNLNGLWGSSATDVWAVGDRGTVLRWDGVAWSSMPVPSAPTMALTGIWGSAKDDVWILGESRPADQAAGSQVLLHWHDAGWDQVPAPPGLEPLAYRIWGSGPRDVWAVGGFYSIPEPQASRVLLHFDGSAWAQVPPPPAAEASFDGICGSGPTDVWVVGGDLAPEAQAIWHWDGSRWASFSSGTTAALLNCWATSTDEAWAVGINGTILRFQGGRWSAVVAPDRDAADLNAIRGSGPTDIWAVGDGGTTLHWDGRSWTSFGARPSYWINGIWGSSPTDVWAVGGNTRSNSAVMLHWDGTAWSFSTAGDNPELNGIWGSSAKDIWAVDASGSSWHWNGSKWSAFRSGTQLSLRAIWGVRPAAVPEPPTRLPGVPTGLRGRAVGLLGIPEIPTGASLHSPLGERRKDPNDPDPDDPKEPKIPKDPSSPNDPAGPFDPAAAKDIWVVGEKGSIRHWNGRTWSTSVSGTSATLNGIWGSGGKDIWAVGGGGTILHWDGAVWTPVSSGTAAVLSAVWGSSAKDVWAVGGRGTPVILHWDGNAWSPLDKKQIPPLKNPTLSSIWGSGGNDVRITDLYSGRIVHWDGVTWSAVPSGASQIQSIWGSGPNDVWVGGLSAILRYRP